MSDTRPKRDLSTKGRNNDCPCEMCADGICTCMFCISDIHYQEIKSVHNGWLIDKAWKEKEKSSTKFK